MINTKMLLETTRDLKVLYVEDDKELCLSTQELLSLYFSKVDIATDGEEGLSTYREYKKHNGEYYDIVMTDISMPNLNGIDMSKEILKLNDTQSIIILSAHNTQEYLYEAISLGLDGFVSKPIDNKQLFRSIFKISQAINDHKMIDSYINQVEELNIELLEKNSALEKKNSELEKSFRMLDTVISKEEIKNPKTPQSNQIQVDQADIREQIAQLINDDLFELKEVLTEIDVSVIDIINSLDNISQESISVLSKYFFRYSAILRFYTFFNDLSVVMHNFAQMIETTPLPQDEETVRNIFTFLETFVYVLSKWHDDLSSGDESKLNQLDASIISDMLTIENMWTQVNVESVDEADLDDIFDF